MYTYYSQTGRCTYQVVIVIVIGLHITQCSVPFKACSGISMNGLYRSSVYYANNGSDRKRGTLNERRRLYYVRGDVIT